MTKPAQIEISASPRMVTNDSGSVVENGESYRAGAVLGGVPVWSAVMFGDKEQQEKTRLRMQTDIKTTVEVEKCQRGE